MSLVFLNVNAHSNSINYAGYGNPSIIDHNAFTTIVDDTYLGIKDLMLDVNSYKFDVVIETKPYLRAYYDGSNIFVTLHNTQSTPINAIFSLLGVAYNIPIVNGQVTFPVTIHPSVSTHKVSVSIIVDGLPHTSIDIGGYGSNNEVQIYQDNTGRYNVVPSKSTDLANYWTAKSVDTSWMVADLATITGLTAQVLFNYVIPALNLNLSNDESSGLANIQSTILSNVVSTLSNIAPAGKPVDLHYASYQYHLQQAKTAMESYTNDRNEIMKYTQLK